MFFICLRDPTGSMDLGFKLVFNILGLGQSIILKEVDESWSNDRLQHLM